MSPVNWTKTCIACQYCCTYVSLEIDAPSSEAEIDAVRWYLAHRRIHIYIDEDDSWYFLVNSECENLTPQGCQIYEQRFGICRDYDAATCEMTVGEPAEKVLFRSVTDFDRWLEFNRERLSRAATRQKDRPKRPAGAPAAPLGHLNPGPLGRRSRPNPPA